MLGNEHFRLKCQKALGSRMPLLDETAAGLVNLYEEEQKVRGLLSQILLNQGKEYTLEKMFLLEKDLRKPHRRDGLIDPVLQNPQFLSSFSRNRGSDIT